jgi:hypothetical protein
VDDIEIYARLQFLEPLLHEEISMDNPYRYPLTRGGFPSHEEARKQIGIDPEDCLPLADAATGLTGPVADTRRCTGYEQAEETGMVRRCSLSAGHEGRHKHVPLAGSLGGSGLDGTFQAIFEPDLAAGRLQGPRSTPAPGIPTTPKRSALRIDLRAGIVDLRSLPLAVLYGERGEYRRVLDMATDNSWSWSTTLVPSVVTVTRLTMSGGVA